MKQVRRRFGIGEWYGKSFLKMTPDERRGFATLQIAKDPKLKAISCPFRSTPSLLVPCTKTGGVCSLRLYEEDTGKTKPVEGPIGQLRATCPNRFQQETIIYD